MIFIEVNVVFNPVFEFLVRYFQLPNREVASHIDQVFLVVRMKRALATYEILSGTKNNNKENTRKEK